MDYIIIEKRKEIKCWYLFVGVSFVKERNKIGIDLVCENVRCEFFSNFCLLWRVWCIWFVGWYFIYG